MAGSRPSSGDVIAGISVALVAIPQSLAYAELAGLPAQYGLYASALPSIFAAMFVSSRQLQTGPVALTALLTFGALSALAEPFGPEYVQLAALLALLVGAFRLVLGLIRAGRIAYVLSEPVLAGFTTAAGILILSSQLPRVFDAPPSDRGVLWRAAEVLINPGSWSWSAVAIAVMVIVVVVGGRRVNRLFPGVLVAVLIAIGISLATNYNGSTVGELSGGFIRFRWSFPWGSLPDLVLPAFAIALVGFAEPASIARTFAALDRERWSADRELISQGVANLTAGISGAFPVGGSFSRSSLNRVAGATSPWAGAITGLVVLGSLPLTPLLSPLPTAVLGAIVIVAVAKLITIPAIVTLARQSGAQGAVAIGTLVATLVAAPRIEFGIAAGVMLSFVAHLYRELSFSSPVRHDSDRLVIAPQGVVWFATVPRLEDRIRGCLADAPELNNVEIDLSGVGRLDYSGASALARLAEESCEAGTPIAFTNVPPGCERAARIHLKDCIVD